jgi:peptide-methionine (R)-S-oxide reductase
MRDTSTPVQKSDEEWAASLTPEQYRVLRGHGTERAGTSPLTSEKRDGTFACAGCGQPLFDSAAKYDSCTGWPSFFAPIEGAVAMSDDFSHGMHRTEVHCSKCGGHLGHVFPDGPRPTGLRFCMNGIALAFAPRPATGSQPR